MNNSLAQRYVASGLQYSFSVDNFNEYLLRDGFMTNTLYAAKSGIYLFCFSRCLFS